MQISYITMLGTGNALATRCYNTCFTLHGADGEILLVDADGGNGILTHLEKAHINLPSIRDLFITHTHTDHLLGAVWNMRMALQFGYPLHVWSESPQSFGPAVGHLPPHVAGERGSRYRFARYVA